MRAYEKVLLLGSLLAVLEVAWSLGGERATGKFPGSLSNISTNDQELTKALLVADYYYNNKSNDAYLFRTSKVDKAQKQIVRGIRYVLDVQISRTVCLKRQSHDLLDCDIQPWGLLHQTLKCRFEVFSQPWLHLMTATSSRCKDLRGGTPW